MSMEWRRGPFFYQEVGCAELWTLQRKKADESHKQFIGKKYICRQHYGFIARKRTRDAMFALKRLLEKRRAEAAALCLCRVRESL